MDALFNDILSSAVHASAATKQTEDIANPWEVWANEITKYFHKHANDSIATKIQLDNLTKVVSALGKQNAELLTELKQLNATAEKAANPLVAFNESRPSAQWPYLSLAGELSLSNQSTYTKTG